MPYSTPSYVDESVSQTECGVSVNFNNTFYVCLANMGGVLSEVFNPTKAAQKAGHDQNQDASADGEGTSEGLAAQDV